MEHSGAVGKSRKAPPRSITPELFDLRTSFAVERRLLPALLLLAVLTSFAAMGAGADALGARLAGAGGGQRGHPLPASRPRTSTPGTSSFPNRRGGRLYFWTAVADLVLWAAMLALVPKPAVFLAGSGGFAAAGAVLHGRPQLRRLAARVDVLRRRRGSGSSASACCAPPGDIVFGLAFPLWLLATWWIGRQQPLARHGAPQPPQTLMSNPTKFGWQAAIHAMPTPVIVARNGRVIEVNRPACEFIGRTRALDRRQLGGAVDRRRAAEALRARPSTGPSRACRSRCAPPTATAGRDVDRPGALHGAGARRPRSW